MMHMQHCWMWSCRGEGRETASRIQERSLVLEKKASTCCRFLHSMFVQDITMSDLKEKIQQLEKLKFIYEFQLNEFKKQTETQKEEIKEQREMTMKVRSSLQVTLHIYKLSVGPFTPTRMTYCTEKSWSN